MKLQIVQNLEYAKSEVANHSNCAGFLQNFQKNCQMEKSFEILKDLSGKFHILTNVARLADDYCRKLNPLATQGEGLEDCQLSKIADLRLQIIIVSRSFNLYKTTVLQENQECIELVLKTIYIDNCQ